MLVGELEVSTVNADGLQPVAVAAAYIHHNHNGETLENDIALLKLQKPVQLQSNTCLICLPARGSVVQANKRCTATGYGYNSKSKFLGIFFEIQILKFHYSIIDSTISVLFDQF